MLQCVINMSCGTDWCQMISVMLQSVINTSCSTDMWWNISLMLQCVINLSCGSEIFRKYLWVCSLSVTYHVVQTSVIWYTLCCRVLLLSCSRDFCQKIYVPLQSVINMSCNTDLCLIIFVTLPSVIKMSFSSDLCEMISVMLQGVINMPCIRLMSGNICVVSECH
jgi:hypothetical protein